VGRQKNIFVFGKHGQASGRHLYKHKVLFLGHGQAWQAFVGKKYENEEEKNIKGFTANACHACPCLPVPRK
jgi:hypothetical protein